MKATPPRSLRGPVLDGPSRARFLAFAVLQHRRIEAGEGKRTTALLSRHCPQGDADGVRMFRNGEEDRQHAPAALSIDHLDAPLPRRDVKSAIRLISFMA